MISMNSEPAHYLHLGYDAFIPCFFFFVRVLIFCSFTGMYSGKVSAMGRTATTTCVYDSNHDGAGNAKLFFEFTWRSADLRVNPLGLKTASVVACGSCQQVRGPRLQIRVSVDQDLGGAAGDARRHHHVRH